MTPASPISSCPLKSLACDHPIAATLFATTLISGLFLLFPQVDIVISGWFHVAGQGFPAERHPFLRDLRDLGMFVTRLCIIGFGLLLLLKLLAPEHPLLVRPRILAFLVATQALGPGLLVNGLLKEYWGRARPRQTDLFGGDLPFSPPWAIVDHCQTNCSFVSGEAASSFWLIAFAFVMPESWRRPVALTALVWAVVMSFNRIAFGGHYLSDILLAWCLVLLIMLILRHVILIAPGPGLDTRIETALTATGQRLARLFRLRRTIS